MWHGLDAARAIRLSLRAVLVGIAVQVGGGCMVIGADRAIDEAAETVARLPCGRAESVPAVPCTASRVVLYHATSARALLSEARRRSHHGDFAQAERFAVMARKAAEEALRGQEAPP